MSTIASIPLPETERTHDRSSLHALLSKLENDASLFHSDRLPARLTALDLLDVRFGGFNPEHDATASHRRAQQLRTRLEAANELVYKTLRADILRSDPQSLLRCLHTLALQSDAADSPGMGFDLLDEVVSGVFQIREPDEPNPLASGEMVPYQPTPVRHILQFLAGNTLASGDLFVDLGSGLGHVPLLVSIFTGVASLGVEVQPAYVASARECAEDLGLSRVSFHANDARIADLSRGTVFYLYSSFKGSILGEVLHRLKSEAAHRPIKICSLGPSTYAIANQQWLKSSATPNPGRITVFLSQ